MIVPLNVIAPEFGVGAGAGVGVGLLVDSGDEPEDGALGVVGPAHLQKMKAINTTSVRVVCLVTVVFMSVGFLRQRRTTRERTVEGRRALPSTVMAGCHCRMRVSGVLALPCRFDLTVSDGVEHGVA